MILRPRNAERVVGDWEVDFWIARTRPNATVSHFAAFAGDTGI